MRCLGPTQERRRQYDLLYGHWLPERGRTPADVPPYEEYIPPGGDLERLDLVTNVHVLLAPRRGAPGEGVVAPGKPRPSEPRTGSYRVTSLIGLLLTAAATAAFARGTLRPRAAAPSVRRSEARALTEPIDVDGDLSDAAWAGADARRRVRAARAPRRRALQRDHRVRGGVHAFDALRRGVGARQRPRGDHRQADGEGRRPLAGRLHPDRARHLPRRPQLLRLLHQRQRRAHRHPGHRRRAATSIATGTASGRSALGAPTGAGRPRSRSRSRRCGSIARSTPGA